ncbi:NAD(P)H-dependent oxidoreductase [Vibrio sonorensis]|uniref:NAD(P)H-dependent oxidoreductase n=1 Tax=Vibrio sonorensis TaxID=1004316 RepID=UPI0008DA0E93|nr:NAD(P)H-dependent oxidoreductase [Vibrio sonorensis]
MSKVVVISGHPNLSESWTNKVILNTLEEQIKSIDIRRLDTLYPNYQIDIEAEQKALLEADIVVLQFPFYWYSVPAIMKKWLDDVFGFNFAYGPEGDKLKDKHLILSLTIGGPEESYDPLGYNHFAVEQLLHPLQQTGYLAGMIYQSPVYSYRMIYIPNVYNTQQAVEKRALEHAEELIAKIDRLAYSTEAQFELFAKQWFDRFDRLPEESSEFLPYISEELELLDAENSYRGKAGFTDWYQSVLAAFKPEVTHRIEQVEIESGSDDTYLATIRVRVQGELQNGNNINQLFNQNWTVTLNDEGEFQIHRYYVTPV